MSEDYEERTWKAEAKVAELQIRIKELESELDEERKVNENLCIDLMETERDNESKSNGN